MASKYNHREDAEAKALIQWADMNPRIRDRLVHVPNGGRRNPREAARLKCMGVRAGYPDYFLDIPVGGFHGLRIELKASPPYDRRVTPAQIDWLTILFHEGYACMVARGWIEAKEGIEMYLRGAFPMRIVGLKN